ncbi:MAG: glycosyltransferase family 2 protein [Rubripirellula sp.]
MPDDDFDSSTSDAVSRNQIPDEKMLANESNDVDAAHWWANEYVDAMHRELGPSACRKLSIYRLPSGFYLTVIVPVFDEHKTIASVVHRLRETGMPMQIVLVNDGSSDGTGAVIDQFDGDPDIVVRHHAANAGKGAAIRTGVRAATGDVIVIQDADREYDPSDFRALLQPILAGESDIAYGTRYGHCDRSLSPWWHQAVNGFITMLASLAVGIRLSDVETCYKMARREQFEAILDELQEDRFGIEIEVTARWARKGLRFTERPIRYHHRWYDEGKKIGWRDGISALRCIAKYGLFRQ